MHVDVDSAVRVCCRKSRSSPGLERNSGNTAVANGQNPFAQARDAAIVQLAVFEAVNAVTGDYRPYVGSIDAPRGASADAAAIEAAYRVLITFFRDSTSRSTLPSRKLAGVDTGRQGQD